MGKVVDIELLRSDVGVAPAGSGVTVLAKATHRGIELEVVGRVLNHRQEWHDVPMAAAGFVSWDRVEEAKSQVAREILRDADKTVTPASVPKEQEVDPEDIPF
jgi:hypothetical protein